MSGASLRARETVVTARPDSREMVLRVGRSRFGRLEMSGSSFILLPRHRQRCRDADFE
jgi:hypothetical protein